MEPSPAEPALVREAIATYQAAGYMLDHGSYSAIEAEHSRLAIKQ